MADLIRGVTVTVVPHAPGPVSAHGDPTWVPGEPYEVDGCLFAPGDPAGSAEQWDPLGAAETCTVYLPKTVDPSSLRHAHVVHRGREYRCVGEPAVWDPSMCPGGRNVVWRGERVG